MLERTKINRFWWQLPPTKTPTKNPWWFGKQPIKTVGQGLARLRDVLVCVCVFLGDVGGGIRL